MLALAGLVNVFMTNTNAADEEDEELGRIRLNKRKLKEVEFKIVKEDKNPDKKRNGREAPTLEDMMEKEFLEENSENSVVPCVSVSHTSSAIPNATNSPNNVAQRAIDEENDVLKGVSNIYMKDSLSAKENYKNGVIPTAYVKDSRK